jgi:hypothetical protein
LHENTSCQHGNFSENDGLFGFIIVRLPWCFNEKNRFESGKYGYDPGGLRIVWRMLDFLMDEEPITVQKRNGKSAFRQKSGFAPEGWNPDFRVRRKVAQSHNKTKWMMKKSVLFDFIIFEGKNRCLCINKF